MKRNGLHFNTVMASVIVLLAAILVVSGCAAQQTQQQQQPQQEQQAAEAQIETPATEAAEQPEPGRMPPHPSQEEIYEDNLDQSLEELDQLG